MDDLQPFFESRETRVNRLPAEARGRFLSTATAAEAAGDKDFADKQFVSLWISQRTGIPRKQVLDNFRGISERFFGPGISAAGAYDRIAGEYKAAAGGGQEDPAKGKNATPGAQKDEEYAPVEGFPKPGIQALMENVSQASRAFMGGFEGFAQKTPAGMYSQAAAVTGAPSLKDPMADPEYAALWKRNQQIEDPYQFTQVFDSEEGNRRGPLTPDEEAEIGANSAKMMEIVRRIDTEHKAAVEEWRKSKLGDVSQEYRRLANFWYGLSKEAPDRWTVDPEFRASAFGQFMESAGSVPATAALAVMGPGGVVGLESAFFADVEGERMEKEGEAYDPQKALPANLASALPQMAMERAFGVERLMNKVLGELPKAAGRVNFGDFAKQFVRQGLTAGVEEGITEPAQGFWNDYLASLTYDQQRETLTGEGAKRRLIESVSGFALGAIFGGGITTLEAIDGNRMVGAGTDYLTTKTGQPMTAADFRVLREVKTDEQITATAPDPETAKVLLAAANGDKAAQADYNNRVLAAKFVKTDGMEVGGMSLGLVDNTPVVKMSDGVIVPLDMTNPEDANFMANFKKEVIRQQAAQDAAKVREQALKDTVNFFNSKVGEGRQVVVTPEERTLRDFIQEGRLSAEEAAARIGIANEVNAANLPSGTKPEDVRVLGANIAEYTAGVYRDVSHIYAGGNVLTAVEEVAEGYAKKRLALGDLTISDIEAWRAKYEAATGQKAKVGDTVSAIEWFSKRAVDYAIANRKAEGIPASWAGFFRTLGEHLKTVFRLAQRMKKLQRDGLLENGFEEALRAATGLGDQTTIPEARRQRQAELESVFPPISSNELFANSAANYDRLKEQLRSEAKAADEKVTRERDFIRARLEEQLQSIADNQLAGDESITMETLTPEQKWTLKAARRARSEGLNVRLSAQADRILQEEGGYEDVQAETRANDAKTWRERMAKEVEAPVQPSEVVEAKLRAEAAANVDPEIFGPEPTVSTVDDDILDAATIEEDFPSVKRDGDQFVATAPTGEEIGRTATQEAAMNAALKWYENIYRGEELEAINKLHKQDATMARLLTDVRQLGGLPAISTEKIFKGELKVIADGLPTHLRLKLFRKKGLQLDALRESINERGYNYDTVTDLLDDLDDAVWALAEKNARGYAVTFSLASGRVDPNQTDMFSGGETGGDTMFNLQGQEATDYTGVVQRQAEAREAKKNQEKAQGEMTFALAPATDTKAFKAWFKDSKVVDAQGKPKVVYHGSGRADRIGSRFWKSRATSGPMAFFTDSADIASNYAAGKQDTSLDLPSDYAGWFVFKAKGMRTGLPVDRAWFYLSPEERAKIAERVYTTGYENADAGEGKIVGNSESIMGKDSIDYEIRQARGNALRALVEIWLNSGALFNDEARFMEVLEAVGMDMGRVEFDHPHRTQAAVLPVYLSIQNPLNTGAIPDNVRESLAKAGKRKRAKQAAGGNSDAWDKNVISGRDWLQRLNEDREKGTTHAWTQIPDWVTETLQAMGYDGIQDTGGKMGGMSHEVWIPFEETQVKSAIGNRGTFDPNNPDITFATTGIPQNQIQALQAQAQRIRSKKLAATGELLARIQSGQSIPARVKAVRRSTQASLLARLAVPVASRLDSIAQGLGVRLRRFEFDLGTRLTQDYQRVLPFAQGVEGMKDGDAALLDLALKNGDTDMRDAVLNTYGLQAQFAEVLKVIDETRQRAEAAGYEVNQIKDYFPRKVADLDGLMVHFYGRPQNGRIEQAVKEASEAAIAQGRVLTAEERMEVVNSALQGFRPRGQAMPGNLKERRVDVVDVDANAYYTDSVTALSYYLEQMNAAIERRRFFGKYSVPVPAVPGATTSRLNLEASIGGLVEDLIARGEIDRQGQQEVQAILEARFNQQASSEFIKNFKGLAYMSTMGQLTSAMTQFSDLAFSMYENGVYDTLVAAGKAAARQSTVTRKSLGLESVAEEFRDTGAMHKAVDRVFKLVGIHYIDLIGKETLTNAKLRKMQREARAGQLGARSREIIGKVFGPQVGAQVVQDLAAGNVTPDVKFAIYNVLADYQPVSLSEYPEFYLRHPNGRVFYMLKTFTLKQIDAFRREAITQIVRGNAKQKAVGFRNLIHLAGLLYMIGVPVDWLKDWIMARDPQLPDIAVDNVFKLLGVNRWHLWQFRERRNPVEAALLLVAPPAPFLVYPLTDVMESAEKVSEGDDIKPGEFESWRMLPFIGAPIYWYLGGGVEKVEKRAQKRRKQSGESRIKR